MASHGLGELIVLQNRISGFFAGKVSNVARLASCIILMYIAPLSAATLDNWQFISDEIVIRIAERSLAIEGERPRGKTIAERGNANSPESRKRIEDVQQFLLSVGRDNWYRNWATKFAPPRSVEERVYANLTGNTDGKLGYYYIRPAPVSRHSMTVLSCEGDRLKDSPTMKAFCALGMWNAAKAFNDPEALTKFRELANWFLSTQVDGKWLWQISVPSRELEPPWISCLSQSLGISVLLREYQLEGNAKFLDAASRALEVMGRTLSQGGCSHRMRVGVWYEEYPNQKKPSHVLNGHMWALFGIWDYFRVTKDVTAKRMFEDGMLALTKELPKYDLGYWSVYSQDNRVDMVGGNYQAFIIEQLKVLQAITSNPSLSPYINRWEIPLHDGGGFVELAAREFLKSRQGQSK